MAEDGSRREYPPRREEPDDVGDVESAKGTGVIFVLIALALILAIGFFYMTKDREPGADRVITEITEPTDSAVRVVGDAAQNAAGEFDRK